MSKDKIEIDVEQTAEAFTDEMSDEALDREKEGVYFSASNNSPGGCALGCAAKG
jgi:hypothetical protein